MSYQLSMNPIRFFYLITLITTLLSCQQTPPESTKLVLWYDQPAESSVPDSKDVWGDDPEWLKALPLGNGSFGAMVFGDVTRERIQLSEESMWS